VEHYVTAIVTKTLRLIIFWLRQ